ncbi:MAG: oxygen-dependent coproporphyrinogen oxidase [Verrucomicrobiota bacterium]|nr:oxygen-dependent coproporphyrinogen oxidase [Verrucomicrobiota bacterium]
MSNLEQAEQARKTFVDLQEGLRTRLEAFDPKVQGTEDSWKREEGGGGKTLAFANGGIIEKGGVNFSDVRGGTLPPSATQGRPGLEGSPFRAMGVSVVIHPDNPHLPTSHANVRYFEATPEGEEPVWWFGGGFDLTPYYPVHEDVVFWHEQAKEVCDAYGANHYKRFKKWCDEYFYLPHRKETRGVGGLFFDDYAEDGFEKSLSFVAQVGKVFGDAYFEILQRGREKPFSREQKDFQKYRRGRYVEFNLVYDRGTHFGLQSGGRTESILMSLPPSVEWSYGWSPEKGSEEARLYEKYLKPRDWLGLGE